MNNVICPLCYSVCSKESVIVDVKTTFAYCSTCETWQQAHSNEDGSYTVFLFKHRPFSLVTSILRRRLQSIPFSDPYSLQGDIAEYIKETVTSNLKLFAKSVGLKEELAVAWAGEMGFINYDIKMFSKLEQPPTVNQFFIARVHTATDEKRVWNEEWKCYEDELDQTVYIPAIGNDSFKYHVKPLPKREVLEHNRTHPDDQLEAYSTEFQCQAVVHKLNSM